MRYADVRIVAVTHRDLAAAVADGSFREDLYCRLKGVVLRILSLAERPGDIALLASLFMRRSGGDGAHWGAGAMRSNAAKRFPKISRAQRAASSCPITCGGTALARARNVTTLIERMVPAFALTGPQRAP